MKLDHDCIRDLMLYFEENLTLNSEILVRKIKDLNYDEDILTYTTEKLIEAEYIKAYIDDDLAFDSVSYAVTSITFAGHSFLDTIRDNGIWSKTKSITLKFTSVSIQLISSIASQVISQLISSSLGF